MHQNNLAIKPSETIGTGKKGLFVTKGHKLPAGTEIPLFGRYMRQLKEGLNGRIVCVQLARIHGDPKALYMRVDDNCPGITANDPAYEESTMHIKPHGIIHEFEDRDIADSSRVCIVIENEVDATEEETEIWVSYNLADVHEDDDDPKHVGYGRTTLQRRKSTKKKPTFDQKADQEADQEADEEVEAADGYKTPDSGISSHSPTSSSSGTDAEDEDANDEDYREQ